LTGLASATQPGEISTAAVAVEMDVLTVQAAYSTGAQSSKRRQAS